MRAPTGKHRGPVRGGSSPWADTAKTEVLRLEPQAQLRGPFRHGHYLNYTIVDGAGLEIGWTEGNEQGPGNAWERARDTLRTRKVATQALQNETPDQVAARMIAERSKP